MRNRATAAAIAGVVAVLIVGGCSAEPVVHSEMDGPMSLSMGNSGSISIRAPRNLPTTHEWSGTFGTFIPCMTTDDGPARVTGLEFADTTGPEPVSAVAYARTFDPATDTPIGSMRGKATDLDIGSTQLREGTEGLDVSATCSDDLGFEGPLTDEILISLTADERGAHVGDVTVTYLLADGSEHAVRTSWDFYLCGSEAPEELC
ncbi:hypothetical protein CLV28_1154 [Sediminihabitans luteus]|uniref:Lipoprotein n=2 Tax=Sediminihabitans luteus TaxID=1138585 RepID=A0A2M9D1B7_9CELL|nr:hypothetical protein CLV28_1154 [Sediminihabitans luteus]